MNPSSPDSGHHPRRRRKVCAAGYRVRVIRESLWTQNIIYDPLYYNHYSDDVDPFLCADREYRREVAAYTRLSTSDSVTRIPKYYGSCSLEIPAKDKSRFVRLILIQKIEGP